MREIRRGVNGSVGFVASLGGIHAGHTTHMDTIRPLCDVLVGSLFLNPTQFAANEDLSKYPADEEADLAEFEKHGVDIVFAPSVEEMYPPAESGDPVPQVDPGPVAEVLEGLYRPDHFKAVATVVARLFSIIKPDAATFGEKDAQQLRIVQHVNESLGLGIDIISIPTVRESDGLAISSRNIYLSSPQRGAAAVLYRSLVTVKRAWDDGERSGDALRGSISLVLESELLASIQYAAVVDADTFVGVDHAITLTRALVAVKFGKTRLIDNLLLG